MVEIIVLVNQKQKNWVFDHDKFYSLHHLQIPFKTILFFRNNYSTNCGQKECSYKCFAETPIKGTMNATIVGQFLCSFQLVTN